MRSGKRATDLGGHVIWAAGNSGSVRLGLGVNGELLAEGLGGTGLGDGVERLWGRARGLIGLGKWGRTGGLLR